jgi:Ca-activated chloride channel homolog
MSKMPSIFAYPWMLSLLLIMPALTGAQLIASWRSRRQLRRLGDPLTLMAQLPQPRRWAWLAAFLFGTGVTALIMGAAGPTWGQEVRPEVVAGRDLVILLDMSNSMRATDAPPDRFHRAVQSLLRMIDYMRQRGGHRLGLVVFAADAQVICPLTYDCRHVQMKLESLDMEHPPPGLRPRPNSQSGTRIGLGLRAAVAIHESGYAGYQDILLVSDGDDPQTDSEWETGLRDVISSGVPIFAVGVGDPSRDAEISVPGRDVKVKTRLIEKPLQEIARRTAGQYLQAGVDLPSLDEFLRRKIESKGGTAPEGDAPVLAKSRHAWFYAAALGLFALAGLVRFRISDIVWRKPGKETGR